MDRWCFLNTWRMNGLMAMIMEIKRGARSCCCGRSFTEQVGLEGGLSREQEKHFRCEYGQCGFFSPRWEQISVWGVGVPFGDSLT